MAGHRNIILNFNSFINIMVFINMYYVVVANASNSTTYLYIIYNPDCNIMLQNEEVWGNTIYSSSEASGVNHIIHRSRRLR